VVKAATHFEDAKIVLEAHEELGEAMRDWMCGRWKRRTCFRRGDGEEKFSVA